MPVNLPEPIAAYFRAESRNDPASVARCFVEHAVVRDEGRTIVGTAAIQQWMTDAKQKYQHRVEPLESAEREAKTVVRGKVSGNFPNSPVTLEHIFALEGGKIASLEIR